MPINMSEQEFDRYLKENKENIKEMLEFWSWIKGSGKAIQWMSIFGLPIAAAIWSIHNWLKRH